MPRILNIYISRDRKYVVYKDAITNQIVAKVPINRYDLGFTSSLPDYFMCRPDYSGDYYIVCKAIVVPKNKWNSIPLDYKGTYIDYDGNFPELTGRKTVLAGCIDVSMGSSMLIEGVHFIIK